LFPRGVIFDLDGTLVDSQLDFDQMRREMGIPAGHTILEALELAPPHEAERMWRIVAEHELRGVERATVLPGVREFLHELARRGIHRAVLTRNSRASAAATLARLELEIDTVVSREDGPVKPDPAGVLQICRHWQLEPRLCVMVGDYRFDIEAGRQAGARTVLFTGAGGRHGMLPGESADLMLASFAEADAFWRWAAEIALGSNR
jgi:HAD superfamily hydrolase (TIGR01509 family)